ncbi:phospholipase D-like domain-containing protein [Hyphomonas sp.]|uniref:phospholipase D-like domain-containing protein n=1 Tax=Hyphomonas sp. TaxID=87 RepID=UPI00391C6000
MLGRFVTIFITVMLLNQLLFFGFCLRPDCLAAATPHVLVITIVIGLAWGRVSETSYKAPDNSEVRQSLDELLSNSQRGRLQEIPEGSLKILIGVDHYQYLIDCLKHSKVRLIIMSGWLSKHVMDDAFLKLVSKKLQQGVTIYIGYGAQDAQGYHKYFEGTKQVLDSLRTLLKKYPDQLFVANFATHEKLLVVDDQTVVIGSANWLSNRQYKNSERSVIISNSEFASSEASRAIAVVKLFRVGD